MEILRLNLLAPLYYSPGTELDPFSYKDGSGEKVFCFEIDEGQRLSIEPGAEGFLRKLVFGGDAIGPDWPGGTRLELPVGEYLFAQERKILGRDEIIAWAIEIQTEGLWQRLKPGNRLYLRYLFEDRQSVTQLFRPYST